MSGLAQGGTKAGTMSSANIGTIIGTQMDPT